MVGGGRGKGGCLRRKLVRGGIPGLIALKEEEEAASKGEERGEGRSDIFCGLRRKGRKEGEERKVEVFRVVGAATVKWKRRR